MKKIISLFLIFSFLIIPLISLSGCGKEKLGADYEAGIPTSYVTLNVNPSVELVVDDKNKVIAINSNNDEGTLLFYGEDYRGYDIDVVIREMVRVMAETGYINGTSIENAEAVFVSVASTTNAIKEEVYSKIKVAVDEFFLTNGLYGIAAQTIFDNKIKTYASANSITDYARFHLILKVMEYDADMELTEVIDLNSAKLMSKIFAEVEKISSIQTKAQKNAYLDTRLTLKEQLQDDLVNIFNNTQYTTLYNELENLREQYRTVELSEANDIKELIIAKEDAIFEIERDLRALNSSAVTSREQTYRNAINQALSAQIQASYDNAIEFTSLLTEKRIQYMQYFEERQEYAEFNNFESEYGAWKPVTTANITTFLSTITTKVSAVTTGTKNEVLRALNRINPYNRSFGFGDSSGGTWTFP